MKIAVMGYGTIGSGVVDVLRINKETGLLTDSKCYNMEIYGNMGRSAM